MVNNEDPRIGSYALDKNLLKIGKAETLDGFEERKVLGEYLAGASESKWMESRGWIDNKDLTAIGTLKQPPYGFARPADIRKNNYDEVDLEGIDTGFSIDLTDAGIEPVKRDDVGEYQDFGELVTDPDTGEITASGFEGYRQTSRRLCPGGEAESVDLDEVPEAIRFADRVSASVSKDFDEDGNDITGDMIQCT